MNRSGEIEGVVPSGEFLAAEATDETKPSSGETKTFALPSCERSAKMDKPSGENSAETAMPEMSIEQMLELLGPDHPIHYTFGLPHWVVGWMGFVSLLYVVLAPWLLWHAADQPLALVCTFSLLACSYLFFWIHCLSETMSVLIVFFRMSYIALLSSFIGHLIGPVNGMAVVYLETFYAAGMLGYAVAEYRQLVGSERSASAVVGHSSESKEKQRRREEWVCYIAFLESCPSLMFLARMVWLVLVPDADRRILFVVMELSLETCGLSFYWGAFVALIWLDGALISVDTVFCRVTVHFGAWCVLSALLTFVVGDAAGMLVLWLITMVMVGFFGYSLAVYAHYKQILATRYYCLCSQIVIAADPVKRMPSNK